MIRLGIIKKLSGPPDASIASWRGILIGKELHWKCSAPKGVACSSHVLSAIEKSTRDGCFFYGRGLLREHRRKSRASAG